MPALHHITEAAIADHYNVLDTIGLIGPTRAEGFLRPGYSPEELAVIRYFESRCIELGLTVRYDAVGNFCAETESPSGHFIEFGSHVDTVPNGGNFDGLAGVVAGFEAIRAHVQNGTKLDHGLRLRIWRLEESSCYGVTCFGSSAAFGIANKAALNNIFGNTTLGAAMERQGYDTTYITEGRRTMPQSEVDSIFASIEGHIEQARSLDDRDLAIGIVTSIRGPKTSRHEITGRFDHAGATPMGCPSRRDANLALGYMFVRLNELIHSYIDKGKDLVQTVGVLNNSRSFNDHDPRPYKAAPAIVSGFAYFTLNVRCADDLLKAEYCQAALSVIEATAKEFEVSVASSVLNESSGIKEMSSTIQQGLEAACRAAKVTFQYMPSGAMHDAAIIAQQKQSSGRLVPTGMIFLRHDGISHSPEEYASHEAIADGARVLEEFVLTVPREWNY